MLQNLKAQSYDWDVPAELVPPTHAVAKVPLKKHFLTMLITDPLTLHMPVTVKTLAGPSQCRGARDGEEAEWEGDGAEWMDKAKEG